ncbi:single-stranded DNA-binding protein [Peptostreptococcus equinus]|uniref:Single-stranded DNA-binding protein n=1 Tax=Peptostreptococcus equinus TaxID=3003601 RepID=A0ABY7JQW4_9FIRM|nr:single-stranded DNA-binding protein [Peptostreptococcus sp. CBA3647]WAW14896.1 single-stranded DNA-binding protein [Peptostreptococcus sp. CBA3647]
MNNVVLVGRLTKDPELRYIPGSGTPVATFTLAIDREYKNRDGSTTTDFIPVEIMGKPAEFCANYITKGRLVGVQGSIRVDRYETPNGEKRNFTKVSGRNIQALESKGTAPAAMPNTGDSNYEAPKFEPSGVVSPSEFSAVDDDDVPF